MPNYDNSKIYKLWIHETDDIYIGSTTQNLSQRLAQHKKDYNKNVRFCSSKILFELSDDVMIELIEEYKCDNKNQLEKIEGEHIRNNKCVNKIIAGRTREEYVLENREKILENKRIYTLEHKTEKCEYDKNYREQNRDKRNKQKQEYYNDNKVEISQKSKLYREQNKDKLKEKSKLYREQNKDKLKEKSDLYREQNKDKINETRREKVECEYCNKLFNRTSLIRHIKTIHK